MHHAVAQNPPKDIVDLLLGSYGKAISTTETAYHRTVLHLACMNRASSSVVETVYRKYPPALKIQDSLKRLPLHYAIANGCKLSTLKLLLDEFPESAAIPDHRNWLALHIACGMRAPLVVVQLLLEKNPMGVLVLDEDGHSPLALAKRDVIPKRAVDARVVRFLEEAMKQELKKRGMSSDCVDESIMIAPVPEYVNVGGGGSGDGVRVASSSSSSGTASKASTLSTKSKSSKKGIFRRG